MKATLSEKETQFWKDVFIAALPSALEQPWERGGKQITAVDERCDTAAQAADAAVLALVDRMLPQAVGRPNVSKPNDEELAAIKDHLNALSQSVTVLQSEVSSLGSQFTLLADRFSINAQ